MILFFVCSLLKRFSQQTNKHRLHDFFVVSKFLLHIIIKQNLAEN